ncbi:MAG: mechanosensitive ion channel [Planctomycetaceae bacterium]|nr:mechanosensitive ion channel family protein [Planctomycetota bacterium]NUN52339.1 mechanosensitive ion channel [Planctomycetaceae bacterium]
MGPVPAFDLFGLDLDREQILEIGATLLVASVLGLLLFRVGRWMKRHGRPSALTFFAALVYVPLLAVYVVSLILGQGRQASHPEKILLYVVIVAGMYIGSVVVDGVVFSKEREESLGWKVPRILRDSIRWALLIITALVMAKPIVGKEDWDLSILAGALTVGLSLSFGPTLGTLLDGIAMVSERPFEIGDWLEVEGLQGRVDQITWRSTRMITRDQQSVVFPNSLLAKIRIVNLSRPDSLLGVRACVGVHFRHPPAETRDALRRAVLGAPGVERTPAPAIRIKEFLDSDVNWEIRFWIRDAENLENIKGEVLQRVWYTFRRAGIEIAYPIHNVLMRDRPWDQPAGLSETEERARRERNLSILRVSPLFSPLPGKSLDWLAQRARDEFYLEGERVVRQGDPGDRMFFIVEGEVRIAIDVEGTQEVERLGPGSFFGEMSLLTGAPRSATVFAGTAIRVISIAAGDLSPVLQEHPSFAGHMAEFAAARRIRLLDLTEKAKADRAAHDLDRTSSNLLSEILRFFRLPGGDRSDGGPGAA